MFSRLDQLTVRILVASVAFVCLCFAALLPIPHLFPLFLLLISLGVFWEWSRLLSLSHTTFYVSALFFILADLWVIYGDRHFVAPIMVAVILLTALIWVVFMPLVLFDGALTYLKKMSQQIHLLWLFVAILSFSYAQLMLHEQNLTLFFMAWSIVWTMDIAAYFGGRWLGSSPLAPLISPKKTVEGAMIAVLGLLILASVYWVLYFHEHRVVRFTLFLLGVLLLGFVSIIGDLFESALKRMAGKKDSGHMMPGHGGLFDRLDSVLAVFPVFYVMVCA